MSGPEFIVAIVAISCATGLLKKWMDNRHCGTDTTNKEELEELHHAFEQHKKEMQKRVQNLEAIVADEEEDDDKEPNYRHVETSSSDSTLTNDLQQKEKV
jgi:hypothetical protein